jgi:hypothetical protein
MTISHSEAVAAASFGTGGGRSTRECRQHLAEGGGMVPTWYKVFLIVAWTFALTFEAVKHGEPREPRNFWTTLVGTAIGIALAWFAGIIP